MDDIEFVSERRESRYVGRECKPKEKGLLYFAMNSGYIQLDRRQKWELEYVPMYNTCFMRYKQLRVKITTETFMQLFQLTHDPCGAVEREMNNAWKRGDADG